MICSKEILTRNVKSLIITSPLVWTPTGSLLIVPRAKAQAECLIQGKMGIVSCPTLSITKLLNQQETGCIQLGSKRSFLMRRRSVFHHIFPPNSKKVLCCIWWKVERQIFVLVPLFCLPKRKHCKQPVHRKKKLDDQCLTEYNEDFHCRDWSCTKPKYWRQK